jgi:sugar O-acyltransferase (sialic acid O-acetyltransferase NeuD family)
MADLVIIGAGGFGAEAVWVAEDMNHAATQSHVAPPWDILGYADSAAGKIGQVLYKHAVLGPPELVASQLREREIWYHVAIGNNQAREKMAQLVNSWGWKAATLIHPTVVIAGNVEIGEGTYVGCGSILCPNARIGRHVLVNVHATVGHDSTLGDFTNVCPGARLNGRCVVERLAFVGSNASLIPGVTIGCGATVGANSQVIMSVKPWVTVLGVPARKIARRGASAPRPDPPA